MTSLEAAPQKTAHDDILALQSRISQSIIGQETMVERLILGLLIGLAIIHYLPRLYAAMQEHKQKREQSEQAYFERLISACKTNDPFLAYRALDEWARRANVRLSEINANGPSDPDLEKEYRMLERAVFSPRNEQGESWQGRQLEIALQKVLKIQRSKATPRISSLIPALNP